jgi:hypothetical protein
MISRIAQLLKTLTATKQKTLAPRARLAVEALEDRSVPALIPVNSLAVTATLLLPPPDPTAVWIDQNIHDPTIHSMVRQMDADHNLSRTDMIQLFQTIESIAQNCQPGLNATQLADLHTLVSPANSSILYMPGYVQNLANKVVNYDPANLIYGGSYVTSEHGLQVGDSYMITLLTDKWFLGQDRPLIPNSVVFNGHTQNLQYTYAQGTLFGSGVSYTDVVQGEAADCYVMAPMLETALRNPGIINNMFIDNGDGTFTVRFFNHGKADYETVDRYLPTTSAGQFVYANIGGYASSTANKLWVGLAEKAYAQLSASGWDDRPASQQFNCYSSLDYGYATDGLQQITGHPTNWGSTIANTYATTIETMFLNGQEICFGTGATPSTSNVVSHHIYAMYGYFGSGSTAVFILANPWGQNAYVNGQSGGMLYLTMDQMKADGFNSWAAANMKAIYLPGTIYRLGIYSVDVTRLVGGESQTFVPQLQSADAPAMAKAAPSHDAGHAMFFDQHEHQSMLADDLTLAWL